MEEDCLGGGMDREGGKCTVMWSLILYTCQYAPGRFLEIDMYRSCFTSFVGHKNKTVNAWIRHQEETSNPTLDWCPSEPVGDR